VVGLMLKNIIVGNQGYLEVLEVKLEFQIRLGDNMTNIVDKVILFNDMRKKILMVIKEGEMDKFRYFLDSKRYFDKFKRQKAMKQRIRKIKDFFRR